MEDCLRVDFQAYFLLRTMKSLNKRSFFFYELHFFNLPLAFILQLVGDVFVFKYRGACQRFLNRGPFHSIQDFTDVDQWVQAKQYAYEKIRNSALIQFLGDQNVKSDSVALKRRFIQQLCIDYEAYFLFCTLVHNYVGPKYVVNFTFREFLWKNHPHILHVSEVQARTIHYAHFSRFYLLFDWLYEVLKTVYRILKYAHWKFDFNRKFQYLYTGISPIEYPQGPCGLDFTWLTINKIVESEDILYILDAIPSSVTRDYLKTRHINFVLKNDLLASLPIRVKANILIYLLTQFFKILLHVDYKNVFQAKTLLQSFIWEEILKQQRPSFFIYSFSAGWPEIPATLACQRTQVKSIVWFYSSGEFLYSEAWKEFKDLSVRYCIFNADEMWVWNSAVKKLFSQRLLVPSDISKIQVVGPILTGDWSRLKNVTLKGKMDAFTISVFDLSPMKVNVRLNYGEGPFCNQTLQEEFFKGILTLYKKFPEIEFIIKTKRDYDPAVYDLVSTLEYLLKSKLPRIRFSNSHMNIYDVIAESDLIISTPFTSPTVLAAALGKQALYYDPIHLCNFSFQQVFELMTIKSEKSLIEYVQTLLEGGSASADFSSKMIEKINWREVEQNLKRRLTKVENQPVLPREEV